MSILCGNPDKFGKSRAAGGLSQALCKTTIFWKQELVSKVCTTEPKHAAAALTKLTLNGNRLERVALELGRLSSLTELHLQANALRELPDSVAGLQVLTLFIWIQDCG